MLDWAFLACWWCTAHRGAGNVRQAPSILMTVSAGGCSGGQHLWPRPKSMHSKEECLRKSVSLRTKISVTSLRQATSFPCGVSDSEYTQSLGCSNRRSLVTNAKKEGGNKSRWAGQACKKARKHFCQKQNNVRRKGEKTLSWQQCLSHKQFSVGTSALWHHS